MSNLEIGILGFFVLFLLLAIRMPVGTAMLAVGVPGIWIIHPRGDDAAIATLGGEIFSVSTVYSLTILPLFILMGNLAGISGMSRDLYDAAHAWFGHLPGGLASSTIVGCAGFSALSGSSLASAVTMGRVALPEMQRYRYDDALATGAIAAGGTLGILIPPSAGFVIYAILTEESIGRLFMAGVLPGILLSALFIATIWIGVRLKPEIAPASARALSFFERLAAIRRAAWIIGIVVVTIGGIYGGAFDAVEAAAIGAFLCFLVCILRGTVRRGEMKEAIAHTLRSTATTFYILMGAFVFTPFVALSGIPSALDDWLNARNADPVQAAKALTGDGVEFAFEAIGDVQAARQGARGEQRLGEPDLRPIVQQHPLPRQIQVDGRASQHHIDTFLLIKGGRIEQQLLGLPLTAQELLGERRAVIGQDRLRTDQRDGAFRIGAPELVGGLCPGQPAPYDHILRGHSSSKTCRSVVIRHDSKAAARATPLASPQCYYEHENHSPFRSRPSKSPSTAGTSWPPLGSACSSARAAAASSTASSFRT